MATFKPDKHYLLTKYHKLLEKIYKSQVLGHVCLESFEEFNLLSETIKLAIINELRLYHLKKPEYIEALRLIAQRCSASQVMTQTGINKHIYKKLRANPLVRKYVYFEDIPVSPTSGTRTQYITTDPLADDSRVLNVIRENIYA